MHNNLLLYRRGRSQPLYAYGREAYSFRPDVIRTANNYKNNNKNNYKNQNKNNINNNIIIYILVGFFSLIYTIYYYYICNITRPTSTNLIILSFTFVIGFLYYTFSSNYYKDCIRPAFGLDNIFLKISEKFVRFIFIIIIVLIIIGNINKFNVLEDHGKFYLDPEPPEAEINQSNILGTLSDMRSGYKEFLGSLSTEELCCLSNLIGFLMVLGGLVSITFILFGDYLINYFKLEERFPKLAKYIQLRQKIQRYTLIFHMFMVYLILIVFIIINAYMFIM